MAVSASVSTTILGMGQLLLQRGSRYAVELPTRQQAQARRLGLLATEVVEHHADVERIRRRPACRTVEHVADLRFGRAEVVHHVGDGGEAAAGEPLCRAVGVEQEGVEDGARDLAPSRNEQLRSDALAPAA